MASYRDSARGSLLGNLTYYLTAPEPADRTMLKEEVRDAFRRYNAGREWVADIMGQPDDAALAPLRTEPAQAPDTARMLRSLLFIVAALLFIPALNLSGMIASRMDSRMAELGIRKAYGATRGVLLAQILWENLVLTALGALLGLLFCCLIVFVSGTWILTLLDANTMLDLPAPFLTLEMLLNPWIFLCALCLCLVLNVASALVPAWWGLRRSIVQELYMKR